MPEKKQNRFPYLKSTKEPLGVVEQWAWAILMRPGDNEGPSVNEVTGALDSLDSWMGHLMAEGFVWEYDVRDDQKTLAKPTKNREETARCWGEEEFRYSYYEWQCLSLQKAKDENRYIAEGIVEIEGQLEGASHSGKHVFTCEMVQEGKGEDARWRLKRWKLTKQPEKSADSSVGGGSGS